MRYIIAVLFTLVASNAFGAAAIVPAFGTFSSVMGGKVSAAQTGSNTLQLKGFDVSKVGGKPTLQLHTPTVSILDYVDPTHPNGNLVTAIADIQARNLGPLQLVEGVYSVDSKITVTKRDLVIEGVAGNRYGATSEGIAHGSQILCMVSAECFEIGTDLHPDHLWDVADYDGVTGFRLSHVDLKQGIPDTNLANGAGTYKVGSYGIRDWRGGSITLDDVMIEGFEYNFWGIQSDVNHFKDVTSLYSRYGIYAGPRSDQFTIEGLYTFFCDTSLVVDGSMVRLHSPQIVGNGSATTAPIIVKNGAKGLVIDGYPWFEKYQGYTGAVDAFIEVGVQNGYNNNITAVPIVLVDTPTIATKAQLDVTGYNKYFAKVGSGFFTLLTPTGPTIGNLVKMISFVNNADATAYDNTKSSAYIFASALYDVSSKLYDNNGTGTPGFGFDKAGNILPYSGATKALNMNGQNLDNALSVTATSSVKTPTLTTSGDGVSLGIQNRSFSSAATALSLSTGSATNSTGTYIGARVYPTINQTSTAGYTALQVNAAETAVGSGSKFLLQLGTGGGSFVEKFSVSNTGIVVAGGGSGNKAICWKTDGKTLGYCSTVVAADGSCTCN